MDKLLTPVSTRRLWEGQTEERHLSETIPSDHTKQRTSPSSLSSADDALEILKNQPDYGELISVLRYLTGDGGFRLRLPTPKSASILNALVTEITPSYWSLLRDDSAAGASQSTELLLTCLRSIAGLNGVMTFAKSLIYESKLKSKGPERTNILLNLDTVLDILASLLAGHDSIRNIWRSSVASMTDAAVQKAQSQQLVVLISNGTIISTAAEALIALGKEIGSEMGWIANGIQFNRWIGYNLSAWAKEKIPDEAIDFCHSLFQRSLSLGYSGNLVKPIIDQLLLSKNVELESFAKLCFHTPQVTKKIVNILLEHLSQRFLDCLDLDDPKLNHIVAAVADLINTVVGDNEIHKTHLVSWCISSSGAGLGLGIGIRRAVLAVLAKENEIIFTVLEKSVTQFGEQIYIRHAPILQQYVHTQIILLSAGYVARQTPVKLKMLLRSITYLNAITNRIATAQARARFLGMVVGESLSALADDKNTRLNFHVEEMETEDSEWLKGLGTVCDGIGPSKFMLSVESSAPATCSLAPLVTGPKSRSKVKPKPNPTDAISTPKTIIEEISSSDEEEELVPYAKESDPEDSDDDATLVQRNKLKAPVYIRDLITYLRDSENYDKQKLALQSAPVLIRRKASFGTEVSSHVEELARLLIGLQDKFHIDNFAEKQQQGMIALVVAQPKSMAPWFARTFFEGDYSLAQKTSVLVTLGLSARELAGYEASEHQSAASFPSKRLPEKMRQLFTDSSQPQQKPPSSRLKALSPTALETISQTLTSSFLGPLAAQAADATAGPDVLKLQTFTQRYKSSARTRPHVHAIPNTTAALLASSFFAPLTAHFQQALRSARPIVLNPALLSLYLQTLGIVVSSAGPATLELPQLTSELWDLLLRIRVHVLDHLTAIRGWLVALTVLIDVHDRDMRSLCRDHGRELLETREWVTGIFQRTRGDDDGEENDVKILAAGALIKLSEAIDNYQALLIGNLLEFG